jgi:hypothetical protein
MLSGRYESHTQDNEGTWHAPWPEHPFEHKKLPSSSDHMMAYETFSANLERTWMMRSRFGALTYWKIDGDAWNVTTQGLMGEVVVAQ